MGGLLPLLLCRCVMDGVENMNPVDHPPDGRLPVDLLHQAHGGAWGDDIVGVAFDAEFWPGETGIVACDQD